MSFAGIIDPNPQTRRIFVHAVDAIVNMSGHRSLLGFVLWHARYAEVLAQDGPSSVR